MKVGATLFAIVWISLSAFAGIPKDCETDKECLIDVPGTMCADGTPSFFTLTKRENAPHLLIYLSGGGACWNKETCEKGYARPLTRVESPTDWNGGNGIHNRRDPRNPFAANYNIVTVPYCTGDVYSGNRTAEYGTAGSPYTLRHGGYDNVKLVMAAVQKLYPTPDKVMLLGCSAGGIGAIYHLRNLAQAFPVSKKYVVSDGGTPFEPPFLKQANYRNIMRTWGADSTLPIERSRRAITDFGMLVDYNTRHHSDIHFGFISSYRDRTMTFFAMAVGALSPFTAVKENIIHTAEKHINSARNAAVFYTDTSIHCHTPLVLGEVNSLGRNMGDWLTDMTDDSSHWANVRPDKHRAVWSALDAGEFQSLE